VVVGEVVVDEIVDVTVEVTVGADVAVVIVGSPSKTEMIKK